MTAPAFRGYWAFLSNFYAVRVYYNNRWYQTAEHAYQAAKMTSKEDHDYVARAMTPGAAKRAVLELLGHRSVIRKDWDEIRDSVMLSILRAKFSDPGLTTRLLETEEQELVEHNYWGDTYWGICNGVGQNKLGKLLMQVRQEIHDSQTKEEQK